MSKKGKVYLVGAGPGRVDLITVRGLELLKTGDCVIYDKLVNAGLLKYARPDAELIATPKRAGDESFTQQQINKLFLEKAKEGKTIVRLKGGDPYIFGRGAEEAVFLAEAGIDFEVVPGVTAAISAGTYAGIAITDRNFASEAIFVTGHEAEGKQQTGIDWQLLARFSGTIVFYMGMGNLKFITTRLIENGMSADTSAAVVADATLPTQRTAKATLATIADRCEKQKIGAPALIFIGPTARGDARLDWLSRTPLFGKTIVITRDAHGNAAFAPKIAGKLAVPIELPVSKIKDLTDSSAFIEVMAEIHSYNWIILTSPNGVEVLFSALAKLNKDARVFGQAKIACIGSQTAAKLSYFGLKADFIPAEFTSKDLAKGLIESINLKGQKILLLRSQLAADDLPQLLAQAGATVAHVPIYTHEKNICDLKAFSEMLAEKHVDWLTFGSPFAATCFFEQVPVDFVKTGNAKIASIGPVTSKKLADLGVKVDIEPAEHTIDGLLSAIEEYERQTK
ncbi:MAG: uroporphyrinogen-III C-methyltransferase [Sedimentisphaerales bacterium]|nr:uroporphyrinogen-III C-methyltransferase [Sedimentisphaerales bacterium]